MTPPQTGVAFTVDPIIRSLLDHQATELPAAAAENWRRDAARVPSRQHAWLQPLVGSTEQFEWTPMHVRRQDLHGETKEVGYFMVLIAHGFLPQAVGKRHKLLWKPRFSFRECHHALDEGLPAIARYAPQRFGQDGHGLMHREIPLGHADNGEVKTPGEPNAPSELPGVRRPYR